MTEGKAVTETAEMIDPMTGEIIDHKELAESLLEQAQVVSLLGLVWAVGA